MNTAKFSYEISLEDGYILDKLSGNYSEKGMAEATNALLQFSEKVHVKKVLYDASSLQSASVHARKKSLVYFKLVSDNMEKLASYIPGKKAFVAAKMLGSLINIHNWQPFVKKEKAIQWLQSA